MSYNNNKKDRIEEERVYSVTMTEEELKLFSEFLEQKEFDEDRYFEDGLIRNRHPHKPVEKMSEDEYNNWLRYSDKFIPDYAFEPKQHRLSKEAYELKKRFVKGTERHTLNLPETREKVSYFEDKIKRLEEENQGPIRKKDKELNDFHIRTYKNQLTYYKPHLEKELYYINGDTRRLMDKEDDLADTGYDDKYSSRAAEILTKNARRRGDDVLPKPWKKAEKIVDNRLDLAQKYKKHDSENPIDSSKFKGRVKETFRDVGRKWDDASMVYNVSTDGRLLGKDAAIAAGVTAGLVGGGIALKKHLKKKRQEKEIAENKYKTSDKKKKK